MTTKPESAEGLRELDFEIHRKVFGWYDATEIEYPHRKGFLHNEHDEFQCAEDSPHYTTDPAASMAVLKKCAEKCCVEIGKVGDVDGDKGWFTLSHYRDICREAATLETAICLLAKKLFNV